MYEQLDAACAQPLAAQIVLWFCQHMPPNDTFLTVAAASEPLRNTVLSSQPFAARMLRCINQGPKAAAQCLTPQVGAYKAAPRSGSQGGKRSTEWQQYKR
jgi:hypothetical protein